MDRGSQNTQTSRVVVFGLDGGTFDLLDPIMAKGGMPNLREFIARGTRGSLQTVVPPITPAAWTTFMTGKNPGKHGVLEFLVKDGGGESPVNSRLRRGRSIFRIASDSGLKVVSLSIPITYPPENIDGLMVSDFMTPRGATDFAHPMSLYDKMIREAGPYRMHINEVYAPSRIEAFFADVEDEVAAKFRAARWAATNVDWRLLAFHVHGADRLQHELWHLIDERHPMHDRNEAAKHTKRFWDFYEILDREFGRLLECLSPNDIVFVVSDHGFGPAHRFLNFNLWLLEKGYLVLKNNASTRLKKLFFDLGVTPANAYKLLMKLGKANVRESIGMTKRAGFFDLAGRFILSMRDIDWSKTVAYSKGYYGQIFINIKGRQAHGSVDPSEYENVRERLVADLRSIPDPDGGALIGPIWRKDELYSGPFASLAPDITFLPTDMKNKAIGMTDFPSNRFIENVYANSGDHRIDGILMARGPGIRAGATIGGATIANMAPTILHMLGLPIPTDMDGVTLEKMFTPEFASSRPVQRCDPAPDDDENNSGYSDAEKADVKKTLKEMGYL